MNRELRELSHGDHCCLLFGSVERQAELTAPFLGIGLERDERCVFIGDAPTVEAVRESLGDTGVDVEHEMAKGRLILSCQQDFLDDGHWKTEKMLGFLQQAYDSALAEHFTALRAAGDVSWQVGPDREYSEVVYYEALLDMFFIGKRMVGMCQYPKAACPAETLSGILRSHRVASIDSEICSNPHYMPPELLVEQDENVRQRKRVDWMTSQLLRIKRAEEERDAMQEQLLHAQKLELVGRLAGSVAHDFNNILTGVIAFSRLVLEEATLDEQTRSDIEEIELAGKRGAALTRQLLAFGRREMPRPRVLQLGDVISGMEKLLARTLGQDFALEIDLAEDLKPIEIDPGQLEQIIMNLTVNARDAMPEGGTFRLSTASVELAEEEMVASSGATAGLYVVLTASDTGRGMDERTQSRIFEPFFTTKDARHGTGLGLSTIHRIVQQNGGTVAVESDLGKGTVFRIAFPRFAGDGESPSEVQTEENVDEELEETSLQGTETVLVLDEDGTVRRLVHRMLESHGYTILLAQRPNDAVELCKTYDGPLHLMITDVLSSWSGHHTSVERVATLRPEMKVLFTPGYVDREIAGPDFLRPGYAILEKPFQPEALLRQVRLLIDGKPSSLRP